MDASVIVIDSDEEELSVQVRTHVEITKPRQFTLFGFVALISEHGESARRAESRC